jgi:hypothetical protein
MLLDSKLHFHNYVSYLFSQCIIFLDLVRSVNSFSPLDWLDLILVYIIFRPTHF